MTFLHLKKRLKILMGRSRWDKRIAGGSCLSQLLLHKRDTDMYGWWLSFEFGLKWIAVPLWSYVNLIIIGFVHHCTDQCLGLLELGELAFVPSATKFMSSDGAEGANWGLIGPLPPWAAEDSLSGILGFTEVESSLMHAKTRLVCMCYSWIS